MIFWVIVFILPVYMTVLMTAWCKSKFPMLCKHIISMAPKRSLWDILLLLCFFFFFLLLLLLFHFPHTFVRHFSRRCLDQTLWNLVGISYVIWSCVFKCLFFQNGCRCHGNGQNAEKLKKHKNYHSSLFAKQKLMKLVRNNIHI